MDQGHSLDRPRVAMSVIHFLSLSLERGEFLVDPSQHKSPAGDSL